MFTAGMPAPNQSMVLLSKKPNVNKNHMKHCYNSAQKRLH